MIQIPEQSEFEQTDDDFPETLWYVVSVRRSGPLTVQRYDDPGAASHALRRHPS